MGIRRVELKERARNLISRSRPSVLLVGLAYIAICFVLYMLSSRLLGLNYTDTLSELYTEYLESGNLEYALQVAMKMAPPFYAVVLSWLTDFLSYVVGAGFALFLLNTIRRSGAGFGNLLDAFPLFFKLFLLNLLTGIFIFLWSLLLVVPGIIAAYRYRQALYIMLDDPDKSVLQCIRESKEMMKGHKGELFVMDLSFIGWNILSNTLYVGYLVQIWAMPYINLSYACIMRPSPAEISMQPTGGPSSPLPPLIIDSSKKLLRPGRRSFLGIW